jgi:putative ABC transport system permease protein
MIEEIIDLIIGITERGLIFSCIVAATYLSSRLINFDNLSIEGSFGLGGALTALLISWNVNPWLGLVSAAAVGSLSGVAVGLLNTKLKLNSLISGIVVTTGLFSITLKTGGANMALNGKNTIFNLMPNFLIPYQALTLLLVFCTILFIFIKWFLETEIGFLLRTVGDTPQMLTNVGKSVDKYKIMGLAISNALAAVGGALFVQYTGYFSIWTSVGLLIIGLAGMIIAETIDKNFSTILIIGSIWYQAIIALTFEMQLDQDWNKLITAMLIILLIAAKKYFDKKRKSTC